MQREKTNAKGVNVRKGTTTSSKLIASLAKGIELNITKPYYTSTRHEIWYGGQKAYIATDYVDLIQVSGGRALEDLSARKEANETSDVVFTVKKDAAVKVYSVSGDYSFVISGKKCGYIPTAKMEEYDEVIAQMLSFANEQLGKKYVYGTEGPDTFDCSGFVYYCLKHVGVNIGRMSSASYAKYDGWTKITSFEDMKPGDILFFRDEKSSAVSHTGIYLGNAEVIHAGTSAGNVHISSMERETGYYRRYLLHARRPF